MKTIKWLCRAAVLLLSLSAFSACEDIYEDEYDSLFHKDAEGNEVCYMRTNYKIGWSVTKVPFMVYYSGSWKAFFKEDESQPEVDWAFLDRSSGKGVGFLRLCCTTNTGADRSVVVVIKCDNGESVDIRFTQEGK